MNISLSFKLIIILNLCVKTLTSSLSLISINGVRITSKIEDTTKNPPPNKLREDPNPQHENPHDLYQPNYDPTTSEIPNTHTIQSAPETITTNQPIIEIPLTTHLTNAPPFTHRQTCPSIEYADSLTQDQFSTLLTSDCRYDRLLKPVTDGPLIIHMQTDIRHIEAAEQLQFKMHMLVQYRYIDKRLDYSKISPTRGHMIGEVKLRNKIWVPHIVLSNERDTSIMGLEGQDVLISISPIGEVIYSYRMTALIYCWMDLQKFPFDEQICNIHFKSWTYNNSQVHLRWEDGNPVMVASQLHLTEFRFTDHWTYSTLEPANFNRGAFHGIYSTLVFKFQITREIGYYIMDYFIPSIMLVCTSWVTFWLQADNAAPRITLGTSTMLSFITLASGQSKNLPKVSYIKASEIWFLGCTIFIFASIAEFAFVNIIWRRKKKIEVKKATSKYILRSIATPKSARRDLQRSNSTSNLQKSHSCSSLEVTGNNTTANTNNCPTYNNYLTVHSFQGLNVPKITKSDDDLISRRNSNTSIRMDGENTTGNTSTTMTPQEIAIWIDRRSRMIFPIAFLIFNIFYWSFVYGL